MRDERLFPLYRPIDAITGIGPKLKPMFEHLVGGETVWDMLLHLPERWLDRRPVARFSDALTDELATLRGVVSQVKLPFNDRSPAQVELSDGEDQIKLVYFRADKKWLQNQFPLDQERIVSGRIEAFRGGRQITHPDYVIDPKSGQTPPLVEPVYRLTAGLTNKRVHAAILAAHDMIPDDLPEWIDTNLMTVRNWPAFKSALAMLHRPMAYDEAMFKCASDRLAYDEALARELSFARARASRMSESASRISPAPDALNALVKSLPYRPTQAQIIATKDITADLDQTHPMHRMLQGDVGSGKTLVGAFAAAQAASGGFQTAFMAPTEVLARQQYETLNQLLAPNGFNVAALTGRDKGKKREGTLLGLADGSIDIVAGTHALFQEQVKFRNLGLVIVDEQHRFGVADRLRLRSKGKAPHMLVMSATPIPRTLAQSIHGDLDVSILNEKPVGRLPIDTRAIPVERIDKVITAIGRALQRGERAFWVCPRVDSDEADGSSAVSRAAILSEQLGVEVAVVHGRLKADEKDQALEQFRTGQRKLLVATTVIEVGVDVPEATIMVIERAEGFGLAQLHQLRGRVGRGSKESFCLLLYRSPLTDTARERLDTLRKTEDGFEIAEADFRLRGSGDILGRRQSGAIDYRILQLPEQSDLIDIARKDAEYAIRTSSEMTAERADALALLSQLLSPDFRFGD